MNLIEKHIEIRIQQIKSRKSGNVDTDTQIEIFSSIFWSNFKYNAIYVKKISNPYLDGRLLNTRVEEHKKNLGSKCNYHNVLSDHRKEYADHDFHWNNV